MLTVPWGVTSHTVTALPCSHFSPCTATGIPGAPAGARAPGRGEQGAGWGQGGGGSLSSLLRSCSPLLQQAFKVHLWHRLLPLGCRICLWIARSDHLQIQSFYLTLSCSETPPKPGTGMGGLSPVADRGMVPPHHLHPQEEGQLCCPLEWLLESYPAQKNQFITFPKPQQDLSLPARVTQGHCWSSVQCGSWKAVDGNCVFWEISPDRQSKPLLWEGS